ncbi:Terminase, ATPase subunit (GpP) [Escherichia coli]|uniref:Terminase, ATPase subunit (GpP) n=1 Tax=Escherichia coli TaxID=562 RepID=A0A2X3JDY1_ECOLX|nr:Terminase, ATPase subunit (GpP) [Escherichia coli]
MCASVRGNFYWQGYPPAEISRLMGINPNTIYAWKKRDQWDETPPVQRVTQSIDARLIQLTEKQNKTGGDFKEIDLLTRQLKKLHDGQPDVMAAGKKGRAKKLKNHFHAGTDCRTAGKKSSAGWSGISGAGLTP